MGAIFKISSSALSIVINSFNKIFIYDYYAPPIIDSSNINIYIKSSCPSRILMREAIQ